jgi:ABC-2 type transport system ATP-binding protein
MSYFPVIESHGLSKTYTGTKAVDQLALCVGAERITGFLGRNGAGKSTTIKMLLGMVTPSSGEGRVLGKRIDIAAESVDLRRDVAYVNEDKRLYNYLTVAETIRFTSSFYSDWRADAECALLRKFELPCDRKVKSLSKGMRTKLALLLALARRPRLLILDEPSEGLDPIGVEQLLAELVAMCAEGTSIFFSSHQIEEVERIADQVCVLDRGRLLLDLSLDEIRQSYRRIDLLYPSETSAAEDFDVSGIVTVRRHRREVSIVSSNNSEAIVDRAHAFGATVVNVSPMGLREVFLNTIGEASRAVA